MFIHKYRASIIGVFCALLVFAVYFSLPQNLSFNFDFKRFFPKDDASVKAFETYRETFGSDDDFLFVALESNEGEILRKTQLATLDTITAQLSNIPNVRNVQSITSFQDVLFIKRVAGFMPNTNQPATLSPIAVPLVRFDSSFSQDIERVKKDPRLYGRLLGNDSMSAAIILFVDSMGFDSSVAFMDEVHQIISTQWEGDHHYVGRANFEREGKRIAIVEFVKTSLLSVALVIAAFIVFFKNPTSIGFSLITMLVALAFFTGMLGLFQVDIDPISALYPVIILIVGVSDVIHITSKYITEVKSGKTKGEAIQSTLQSIGLATFLTSATTAIGFCSLFTSKVVPIRIFGLAAAAGIMITFLVVIFLTLALFTYIPPTKLKNLDFGDSFFTEQLKKLYHFTLRKGRAITIGFIGFLALCFWGISTINTDLDIATGLPRGEKLTDDFYFFEEHYSGFRPYEILLEAQGDYSLDDYEILVMINSIVEAMHKEEDLSTTLSILDVYKQFNYGKNLRKSFDDYALPDSMSYRSFQALKADLPPTSFARIGLVSEDGKVGRISSTVKDLGTSDIEKINVRLQHHFAEHVDPSKLSVQITGTGTLIDQNNAYLRQNLLFGLSGAVLIIGLVMAVLFKNWKFLVISIIPNVFPLVFGAAVMGVMQISLDATTSMIFAISFGIAVDDTIHFLSKLRLELGKSKSLEKALYHTTLETGRPIIVTSIILFFGFLVMLFAKAPGMMYVGLLVSLTLFSAVFADLFLIPILCRSILKKDYQ
ncbi:MAG: efflux RND transporter permease subunit [Chitinophagales bacterium]